MTRKHARCNAGASPGPQGGAALGCGEASHSRKAGRALGSVSGAAVHTEPRVTPFQERLYALCKCVPAGRVVTYRTLAVLLSSAPRAVGQGMRRNPFAPVVPCHRVIAASLDLGGFNGGWGPGSTAVGKKRRLLAAEGVLFTEEGRLAEREWLMGEGELRRRAAAQGLSL